MGCNKPGKTAWADEARVTRLTQLWDAGLKCNVIADVLSAEFGEPISRNAVVSKVARLNLPRRDNVEEPRTKPVARAKPLPTRTSVPLPPEDQAPPTEYACMLDALTMSRCAWPLAHKQNGEWLFCGRPAKPRVGPDFVLCDQHVWAPNGMFRPDANIKRGNAYARSMRKFT
jgi:hypothetical protein